MAVSNENLENRRQRALDRLTEAFAADQIRMEDYESRVVTAQNAREEADIEGALRGLQPVSVGASGSGAAKSRSGTTALANRIDSRIRGAMNLACVMGDRNLSGDWLSGDLVGSFTLMGSTKIDLRDTALPPGRIKIDAFVVMGELKIIVPRGLPVLVHAFPFMGETHTDRDVERRVTPDQPFVEVNGFAFMGSLRVVSGD